MGANSPWGETGIIHLLSIQRRLKFKSGRNETVVLAVVVEPKLSAYSSDSTYRTDVVVRKSFALSSK